MPHPDASPPKLTPPAQPPRRVLVVDDNRDAGDSTGMLLELLGAEVRVEHDGPSALAAIDEWHPALVILDLGMPGMDGYEVAHRIREQPKHAELKVVALTGWGQEKDKQRTRDAGFDQHLVKPVDLAALEALLSS